MGIMSLAFSCSDFFMIVLTALKRILFFLNFDLWVGVLLLLQDRLAAVRYFFWGHFSIPLKFRRRRRRSFCCLTFLLDRGLFWIWDRGIVFTLFIRKSWQVFFFVFLFLVKFTFILAFLTWWIRNYVICLWWNILIIAYCGLSLLCVVMTIMNSYLFLPHLPCYLYYLIYKLEIELLWDKEVIVYSFQEVALEFLEILQWDSHGIYEFLICIESFPVPVKVADFFIVFDSNYNACAQ